MKTATIVCQKGTTINFAAESGTLTVSVVSVRGDGQGIQDNVELMDQDVIKQVGVVARAARVVTK